MSCALSSGANHPRTEARRRWRRWLLGTYRLGLIAAALFCLHALRSRTSEALDTRQLLDAAQIQMPEAVRVGGADDGVYPIFDASDEVVGHVTATLPQARDIHGYSGPSGLLVFLDRDRKVTAVDFLSSADTEGHVAKVREDREFWRQWDGKSETQLGHLGTPRIVSGATLTSDAMARGVAARFGAQGMDQWFPDDIRLADLKKWFPNADAIRTTEREGVYAIFNKETAVGTVLRSSRMGVKSRGYNGISDVILVISADGAKLLGAGLLGSRDNEPYVGDVKEELRFLDGFAGRSVAQVPDSGKRPLIVSGASYTAGAVIASVEEMLAIYQKVPERPALPWKSGLAFLWIGLGAVAGFSKRAGKAKWRTVFAVVSVAAGLGLGWMISQDQLVGWGRNGISGSLSMPLLAMTAVALLIPAFTGKNVYCSRICPHGAAQTLLGKIPVKRLSLPPKIHAAMSKVPWLTLLGIWVIAFLGLGFPISRIEPFEIWSSGFYAVLPAFILTIGLVAAVFLPQGYCHYGCPTGALLKFLSHSPAAWTVRDSIATVLILTLIVRVWI